MSTLFNITHDANNLNEYDSTVTDGGDLSTGTPGLVGTTAKMEVLIDDANDIYGQKNLIAPASDEIRLRFYMDPNGLTMNDGDEFVMCKDHFAMTLVYLHMAAGGQYQILWVFYEDGGAYAGDHAVNISDAEHYIEWHIERSTGADDNNGRVRVWVDGVLAHTQNNCDNWVNFGNLDYFRLGAFTGIDAGTSGTFYLDEFKANDDGGEIGPRLGLQLLIDGVNHISELVHESLTVYQTNDGLNSVCEFDIRDADVIQANVTTQNVSRVEDGSVIGGHTDFADPKVEVSVVDGVTVYFAGILSRIAVRPVGQIKIGDYQQPEVQILVCHCHDFNALLEESVIDALEEYVNTTDEAVIDDIFGKYVTGIDFATHVDGGAFTFKSISFENITVRQALDLIVARTGYVWYVDYSKKLHYSEAEANSPAWHLSDVPDEVNSFSYLDPVNREVDATNLVNRVFIVSSVGATWFIDAASIAKYGDHRAIVRDERLSITESIAARGAAILAKFKDPIITYVVRTYKDGLRAGMHVRFVCAYLDVDDTFLISKLRIEFPVDGEPIYELTLGGLESSAGSAAHRYILDELISGPPIPSSQLPLASRGWGHDLTFSSTDDDTVAWAAGTLTTASGQTFAIAAGNTDDPGAMAAKTIVYLDAVISLTELQMTTDEMAALGANRIMVAVCWPGIAAAGAQPEVKAGFQVFGATAEIATFLNATNVIANAITANEIYCNTLAAISADMGTLTAGTIQTGVAGTNRVVINIADGIRGIDAADVVQFQLDPADGVAYAGAGAVWLDEDGLSLTGADQVASTIKWLVGGVIIADQKAYVAANQKWMYIQTLVPASNLDRTKIYLEANAPAGSDAAVLSIISGKAATEGWASFSIEGAERLDILKDYVRAYDDIYVDDDLRVGKGLYVGATNVDPDEDDIWVFGDVRIGRGLYVGDGALGTNPDDDDIWCDGEISTDGGTTRWNLKTHHATGDVACDGYVDIDINGTPVRLMTRA